MELPTTDYDRSDVDRLPKVLRHQQADRVPHIELWVTGRAGSASSPGPRSTGSWS
jgi:hypothetical protein